MALHLLKPEEVHASCWQRIDACELWLRTLIHDQLSNEFGADYVDTATIGNNAIFSPKLRERIQSFQQAKPNQYPRPVDTLLFDDLGTILGRDDAYKLLFKEALNHEFPLGAPHVRHIIKVLVKHRNALFHANSSTLSLHDAEQVLCYGNDLIASIKTHYANMSTSDKFPAPTFTKYFDSFGNSRYLNKARDDLTLTDKPLFFGELARFEVEVDSSYSPNEYTVVWRFEGLEIAEGPVLQLTLGTKHVGQRFGLQVEVVSKKEWHRMGRVDALLTITYEVLPIPRPA